MSWTIGVLGFDSRRGLGIFLFTTASRKALGPTQPPIQWVPGALSLGVKQLGREVDHSPPSSAEVKNVWSYTSTLPIRLHGVVLSYSTGTTLPFTFYLYSYTKKSLGFFFHLSTTTWRRIGEWRYSSIHSWPQHLRGISDQLHVPAALPPGKEPLVPTG
jgi:hypothetical protein